MAWCNACIQWLHMNFRRGFCTLVLFISTLLRLEPLALGQSGNMDINLRGSSVMFHHTMPLLTSRTKLGIKLRRDLCISFSDQYNYDGESGLSPCLVDQCCLTFISSANYKLQHCSMVCTLQSIIQHSRVHVNILTLLWMCRNAIGVC